MSKIEDRVIDQIKRRAEVGESKYNTTMERNDLSLLEWLQHLQEELMDAAIYIEKLKGEIPSYDEDAVNKRMDIIGRNGNDGEHYEGTIYPDIKLKINK